MYLAEQNRGALSGLNGRCGWICRKLNQLADWCRDNVPVIGNSIANKLQFASDVASAVGLRVMTDYEPTASEDLILNNFKDNKLQPFLKSLADDVTFAFTQTSLSEQLIIINNVLNKMCVVQKYFNANETAGLSQSAINLRSDLIENAFRSIHDLIDTSLQGITQIEVDALINKTNASEYYPIITSSPSLTVRCYNYVNTGVSDAPIKVTEVTTTSPSTTTSTNLNTISSKRNLGIAIGLFALALVLAMSGKKSKN